MDPDSESGAGLLHRLRGPLQRLTGVLLLVLASAFLISLLMSWMFETRARRTLLVSADTTRLVLTVREKQAAWPLGPVTLCLPRAAPQRRGDFEDGCDTRRTIPVKPGADLPDAAAVALPEGAGAWTEGAQAPKDFVFSPAPGAAFEFDIDDAFLTITVVSRPCTVFTDLLMPGAQIVLPVAEIGDIGRYLVRGELALGTPASTSTRGLLRSGEIIFKGRPFTSAVVFQLFPFLPATYVTLRTEPLATGDFVRFHNFAGSQPAVMSAQIVPYAKDGETGFFVRAVNPLGRIAAFLEQPGAAEVRLVPLWPEVLLGDPFVLVFITFGGATGLMQLLRRPKKPVERQ